MKMKGKHVRRACRLLLALVILLAICDGCQPSFGFGASAAPASVKTVECSVDAHCESNQYCFQHTGKCSPCAGEILCQNYGRRLKSSVTRGCVKSVADCGSCLPSYREESDYCVPAPLITDSFDKLNKSDKYSSDFSDVISGSATQWIAIGVAIIIVPFIAVCLVFMTKTLRKRNMVNDTPENLPMVPLKSPEPGPPRTQEIPAIAGNISDINVTNNPEEYGQPPPYAPPAAEVHVQPPTIELNREVITASNQQAVPFDYGQFGGEFGYFLNDLQFDNQLDQGMEGAEGMELQEEGLGAVENGSEQEQVDEPLNDEGMSGLDYSSPETEDQNGEEPDAESVPPPPNAASTPRNSNANPNTHENDSGRGSFNLSLSLQATFDPEATFMNLTDFSGHAFGHYNIQLSSPFDPDNVPAQCVQPNHDSDRVVPEVLLPEPDDLEADPVPAPAINDTDTTSDDSDSDFFQADGASAFDDDYEE